MDKSTPKSYRSTADKSKIMPFTRHFLDQDIQMEKEYLEKLKAQRIKAEKLFHQYTIVSKDRDRLKQDKQNLQEELDRYKLNSKKNYEENQIELIKLTGLVEQLQIQNRTLKAQRKENQQFKHNYHQKMKQLQSQINLYQESTYNNRNVIEQLETEIENLEADKKRLLQSRDIELNNLSQKKQSLQKNYQNLLKQVNTDKEIFQKEKRLILQQKQKLQQAMLLKVELINSIKSQHDSQIKDQQRNYQIIYSQLQESKKFWAIKFDQKNREISNMKKNIDCLKEQCKKLRNQTDGLRYKYRQQQQKEQKLKSSWEQSCKQLDRKDKDFNELQEKYLKAMQSLRKLQFQAKQTDQILLSYQKTNCLLRQNGQQYLKIIKKKEAIQQERLQLFQTQYQEITKMEQIFKKFQ